MASELSNLSDKINQLAELTQQLRRENAELRLRVASLITDKAEISSRMTLAAQKVSSLMEKFPAPESEEEESA